MTSKRSTTTEKLAAYKAKRDFGKSPEPTGSKSTKRPRKKGSHALTFCVQKHLASHLHYDFRLEYRGVLLSWAVPKGPSLQPADKRLAMKVEDHPLAYGNFEGVIPEGYGAGVVLLWDQGEWFPEAENIEAALAKGDLKFRLEGTKLKGSWVLVKTNPRRGRTSAGDDRSWLLIKHKDEWAGDVDVTEFAPLSVKSFGDLSDILSSGNPDVWKSHRPTDRGQAGALLKKVIAEGKRRPSGSVSASINEFR